MFFSLFLVVLCSMSTFAAPYATEIDKRGYMIGFEYIIKQTDSAKDQCRLLAMTKLKEGGKPNDNAFPLSHGIDNAIQETWELLPQVALLINECTKFGCVTTQSRKFDLAEMEKIDQWYEEIQDIKKILAMPIKIDGSGAYHLDSKVKRTGAS